MASYEDEDEMELSYQAASVSPMTSSQAFTKPSANTEVASAHRRLARIVDLELAKNIVCGQKILTDAAKAEISKFLESAPKNTQGMECGRPSFMLPSPRPQHYSFWCTMCSDRNTAILLCAGCRVGLCTQNENEPHTGCLKMAPEFRRADFVFYCPFCTQKRGMSFKNLPSKRALFFRYDPPTLLIDLHLPHLDYGKLVKSSLEMLYKGNLDSGKLCCMRTTFGKSIPVAKREAVADFLQKYPLAKIVIILDTRSSQDGDLITHVTPEGATSTDYFGPVLQKYLPEAVKKYVESPSTVDHNHRTFVLNMSCGSSVVEERAREMLLTKHCAEVVMSFAIGTVVPMMVGGPVPELIMKWVGTPLSLVDIIAHTMTEGYVETQMPVFSSKEWGHFTLIKDGLCVFGGRKITCDRCPPTAPLQTRSNRMNDGSGGRRVTISCRSCGFVAKYKLSGTDRSPIADVDKDHIRRIAGTKLVRTPYPLLPALVTWNKKQPPMAPAQGSKKSEGRRRRQPSALASAVQLPVVEYGAGKRVRRGSDAISPPVGSQDVEQSGAHAVRRKRSKNCNCKL